MPDPGSRQPKKIAPPRTPPNLGEVAQWVLNAMIAKEPVPAEAHAEFKNAAGDSFMLVAVVLGPENVEAFKSMMNAHNARGLWAPITFIPTGPREGPREGEPHEQSANGPNPARPGQGQGGAGDQPGDPPGDH